MLDYRPAPLGTRADVGVPASFAHGWNSPYSGERIQAASDSRDVEHNVQRISSLERDLPSVSQSPAMTCAPIHKLPPEILGEIFAWCIPSETSVINNSSAPDSAPFLLLRVCKLWQGVALGTPQLWTRLDLCGLQGVNPLSLISTWLHRSGTLPIDVYINPLTWNYPINLPLFSSYIIPNAIKLLGAEFHRVRTFHASNFPAILEGLLPVDNPVNAPLLRDFRMTSSPKSSGHSLAGHVTAPNLVSLEICDPHSTLRSITPNYQNLLSLRWNGSNVSHSWDASLDHLVPLLQSCSNLEKLEIIRPRPSLDFLSPNIKITLPRVRHLSLLWKETVDIMGFLHHLDLPALESLRLEMERTTSTRANLQRVLGSLFPSNRPPPPLKALHVVHLDTATPEGDLPADSFSPSLQFPTLECLRLEDCSVHNAFLAALTPDPNASIAEWTLPRLAALHVLRASLDGACLARMVASRSRNLSSFQELSLSDCGGISSIDIAVLHALADRGWLVVRLDGMVYENCEFAHLL